MHVVIIGAGFAGLATAIRLARGGCTVTVLESAREIGGRARSTVHGESILNLGPHALYTDALAELAALGVRPSVHTPVVSTRLLWGGELCSPLAFCRVLPRLARLAVRDPADLAGVRVGEWLERELSGPSRELATALVRLTSYTERQDLDAGVALAQLKRAAARGVRYVDGGWQTIVDGLARLAAAEGVTIRTGVAVRGLDGTNVLVRGGAVNGDAVVIATASGARELLPELPELPASHASCLDVVLSDLPRRSPGFVLGVDEPLYLSVHSLSAALGPGAVVHVAAYGGAGRDTLEATLDLAQPGWRERVVHARYLPKMTVMHGLPVVGVRRPDVEVRPGLVLAGDFVGEGLLSAAALTSARDAAAAILARREELAA